MNFEEMMIFQQNMPTKEWSEEDLATVIAEAYVYQNYFNSNKWGNCDDLLSIVNDSFHNYFQEYGSRVQNHF